MSENKIEIQKVPHPEGYSRIETGPLQFGDDWPGVFIRGDNAIGLSIYLHKILEREDLSFMERVGLQNVLNTLASCNLHTLK